MSVFQGDPAISITSDGAILKFIDGQPVLDKGFENAVIISLFTKQNWFGNSLFEVDSQKIGSDFEASMAEPINLAGINNRRLAAERALSWLKTSGKVKDVDVNVTNPKSNIIIVSILITPPNGEKVDLTLENFGANWRFQATDPAHRRF